MGTLLRTLDARPARGRGDVPARRRGTRSRSRTGSRRPTASGSGSSAGVEEMSVWCWFGGKYVDYVGEEPVRALRASSRRSSCRSSTRRRSSRGPPQDWIADRAGAIVGEHAREEVRLEARAEGRRSRATSTRSRSSSRSARVYDGPTNDVGALLQPRGTSTRRSRASRAASGRSAIKAELAGGRRAAPEADRRDVRELRPRPTKTETEKEFQNGFVSMLGNVKLMLTAICTRHRLRHPPHRRQHDGDGGARARHRDRRPADARLPEARRSSG